MDGVNLVVSEIFEVALCDPTHQANILATWRDPGPKHGPELLKIIGFCDIQVGCNHTRFEFFTFQPGSVALCAIHLDDMPAA